MAVTAGLDDTYATLSAGLDVSGGAPAAAPSAAPVVQQQVAPAPSTGFDGELGAFMAAIRKQESSDNYGAIGPSTRYGRARGAYQILASNWDSWAAQAGLPGADWRDKDAQDRVATHQFTRLFQKYGRWDAVAVAWFAGEGRADRFIADPGSVAGISDGGSTIANYVRKAMDGMATYLGSAPLSQAGLAQIPKKTLTRKTGRDALLDVFSSLMTGKPPEAEVQGAQQVTTTEVAQPTQGQPFAEVQGENGRLPTEQLVPVDEAGHLLAPAAAANWQAMVAAAAADGVTITIGNSYRTYEQQVAVAAEKGLYSQGGLAAEPGTSRHGLATAVDINQTSAAVAWLQEHAAEYGFATIPREPWHWQYEGGGPASASAPAATTTTTTATAVPQPTGADALREVFSNLLEV